MRSEGETHLVGTGVGAGAGTDATNATELTRRSRAEALKNCMIVC
jgi:hypothetical protein